MLYLSYHKHASSPTGSRRGYRVLGGILSLFRTPLDLEPRSKGPDKRDAGRTPRQGRQESVANQGARSGATRPRPQVAGYFAGDTMDRGRHCMVREMDVDSTSLHLVGTWNMARCEARTQRSKDQPAQGRERSGRAQAHHQRRRVVAQSEVAKWRSEASNRDSSSDAGRAPCLVGRSSLPWQERWALRSGI